MTKKIYILAFLTIVSVVLFGYLSSEYYAVQYGATTGDSICSINDSFNCEAVAASEYANLFGIPNAVLGLMLNFVILIGLFGLLLSADDKESHKNWLTFNTVLFGINFSASILMAAIALTAMSVYCLFCICLYVLSTLSFILFLKFFKGSFQIPQIIGLLKSTTFLALFISIPALGFLGHKLFQNEYSPKEVQKQVNATVKGWRSMPTHDFSTVEPIFKLNPGAKVKVVEFADFLCPHCSVASKSLKAFMKNHKNVEFSFYAYPLDPNCNSSFDQKYKGPGFSCTLAKGVLCAQKQGQGVQLHNDIFKRQPDYKKIAVSENNEGLTAEMIKSTEGLDEEAFKSCLKAPESQAVLQSYVKLGQKVGIQGTPTIYVNSKKLDGGANFLILKAAYDELN